MTKRTPIIAGNWKMHNTLAESAALVEALKKADNKNHAEIIVAPSFTSLAKVAELAKGSALQVCAQDIHWEDKGAFTSAVSPVQAKDAGATHTILGHSERRSVFGDTDEILNKKVAAALRHGLTIIFCVGETLAQREANETIAVIDAQLENGLKGYTAEQLKGLIIAYEPVWAIGTGKTASFEQAEEVCAHIRKTVAAEFGQEAADGIRIQYGGSVKPATIKDLMKQPNVDGALVGGASLKAKDFSEIVNY